MAMTFVNHILYENWSPALVSDWIKGIEYMSCLWSRIPFIFDSYVRPTGAFWKTWNHTPGFPCTLSDSGNFNYKSANTTLSFNQDDIFFTNFLLFEWGYLSLNCWLCVIWLNDDLMFHAQQQIFHRLVWWLHGSPNNYDVSEGYFKFLLWCLPPTLSPTEIWVVLWPAVRRQRKNKL